jgi:polyisoprenoid-binding protein YceI
MFRSLSARWHALALVPLALANLALPALAEDKAAAAARPGAGAYVIDPAHTTVGFQIRHLVSKVTGRFTSFTGSLEFDPANLAATQVQVDIEAASINTGVDRRDADLRSANFFDVQKFPKLTFRSTSVKPVDATHAQLTGDLTIKGITKPVTLEVEVLGIGPGMQGETRAGFEARGRINRTDFDVVWNRTLEGGGILLGNDVDVLLQVEAYQPAPESAAKKG